MTASRGADNDDRADRTRTPVRSARSEARALPAPEAAATGLRHIAELTGKEPIGVTSVQPAEDGWLVGVEVVEDRRVPSSTDMLAIYEAQIGSDGTLVAYRRTKRYMRGRSNSGEGR